MMRAAILMAAVALTGCDAKGGNDVPIFHGSGNPQKLGQPFYEAEPDKIGEGDVAAKPGDIIAYIDSWEVTRTFFDESSEKMFSDKGNIPSFLNNALRENPFDFSEEGRIAPWWRKYQYANVRESSKSESAMRATGHINTGHNIYETWHLSMNAQGQPYRLTLTARQGNKVLVETRERGEGNWPKINLIADDTNPAKQLTQGDSKRLNEEGIRFAIEQDANEMSSALANLISGGE